MGFKEKSASRKKRICAHVAQSFKEAEDWDLDFWQSQGPQKRLSALVAIRKDIDKVMKARWHHLKTTEKES